MNCPTAESLIIAAREARRVSPDMIPELKRAEREHVRIGAEHYREAARLRKRIKAIQKANAHKTATT